MAELAQGFGFNLPDTLAGDPELLADFLERPGAAVFKTEPEAQHLTFALVKLAENLVQLLLEQLARGGIGRGQGGTVLDEVAEVAVFLLADRRFQRYRALG